MLRLALWRHRRTAALLREAERQLEDVRHQLDWRRRERESLEVQLTAYRDTVESFAWERRAQGAEAKVHAESLRQR